MALATHKVASVALGIGQPVSSGGRNPQREHHPTDGGVWPPRRLLGARIVLGLPDRWTTTALGVLTLGLGISVVVPAWDRRMLSGVDQAACRPGWKRALCNRHPERLVDLWHRAVRHSVAGELFGLSYTRAVAHTLILVGLLWNGTGALVPASGGHPLGLAAGAGRRIAGRWLCRSPFVTGAWQ